MQISNKKFQETQIERLLFGEINEGKSTYLAGIIRRTRFEGERWETRGPLHAKMIRVSCLEV